MGKGGGQRSEMCPCVNVFMCQCVNAFILDLADDVFAETLGG